MFPHYRLSCANNLSTSHTPVIRGIAALRSIPPLPPRWSFRYAMVPRYFDALSNSHSCSFSIAFLIAYAAPYVVLGFQGPRRDSRLLEARDYHTIRFQNSIIQLPFIPIVTNIFVPRSYVPYVICFAVVCCW
jgi:hypothetical protein